MAGKTDKTGSIRVTLTYAEQDALRALALKGPDKTWITAAQADVLTRLFARKIEPARTLKGW